MRLTDIEKHGVPISFLNKGQVEVRVGPCSIKSMQEQRIPLDGRRYICAGTIILRDGLQLRANFEISTHTFDFLDRESVVVYLEGEKAWYFMHEEELFIKLGIAREDALPYKWNPDIPLDHYQKGPYPMNWPED